MFGYRDECVDTQRVDFHEANASMKNLNSFYVVARPSAESRNTHKRRSTASTEDAMRVTSELAIGLIACLFSGCASMQTAPGPEAKQALAPTGTLRVAFLATAPTHAMKDPATGELKGPAVDLGRE